MIRNKKRRDFNISPIVLPIISAILLGLTRINGPFDMLVFVAFIPLFYYFERGFTPIPSSTFRHGFVFSTIYMLISLHWICLVTVGGFIGMIFLFGVIIGLMFMLISFMYKLKPLFYPLSLIIVWMIFEFLTNFTEFQFPWFAIGYGLDRSLPFLQVLEFGGLPALSFLILLVNYLFYISFTRKSFFFYIAIVALLVWYWGGYGRMKYIQRHTQETDFTISMLQGNIAQELKWEDDMLSETFEIYEELALSAVIDDEPDLIIYPEAALPTYLLYSVYDYGRLMSFIRNINTPIFTGFPHSKSELKYKGQIDPYLYYNAANLFHPQYLSGEIYYKNILVPFGERIPFLDKFPILWKLQMGQANWERGEKSVIYDVKGNKFAPLICFEIAFPLFIRNIDVKYLPDFWVNITNDAWFYRSIGTRQHAVMAVYRTIETRKPVFRVANTGYTFYTTPDGKIEQMTKLFFRTKVTGNLSLYDTVTPFVAYGYLFPLIIYLFFTLQIISLLILSFKKIKCGK